MVDIPRISKILEFEKLNLKFNQGSNISEVSDTCKELGTVEEENKREIKFLPSWSFHGNGMTGWLEKSVTVRDVNG